jgi:hypothetical protein
MNPAADYHSVAADVRSLARQVDEQVAAIAGAADQAVSAARDAAVRDSTASWNTLARRLRQAENREEWTSTLLDAASRLAEHTIYVAVSPRGLSVGGEEIRQASAPALQSAVESRETLVAAASASEVGERVAAVLGQASRVWLIPIVVREKTTGVLCAAPAAAGEPDVAALELLGALASGSSVGLKESTPEARFTQLVQIGAPDPETRQARPSWEDLSREEQALHLRAQQFSRVRVSELLLRSASLVQQGRANADLYGSLKREIDAGREAFRREFFEPCPSMVDYFHLELVRTLAGDDQSALGSDYPGPLS